MASTKKRLRRALEVPDRCAGGRGVLRRRSGAYETRGGRYVRTAEKEPSKVWQLARPPPPARAKKVRGRQLIGEEVADDSGREEVVVEWSGVPTSARQLEL